MRHMVRYRQRSKSLWLHRLLLISWRRSEKSRINPGQLEPRFLAMACNVGGLQEHKPSQREGRAIRPLWVWLSLCLFTNSSVSLSIDSRHRASKCASVSGLARQIRFGDALRFLFARSYSLSCTMWRWRFSSSV